MPPSLPACYSPLAVATEFWTKLLGALPALPKGQSRVIYADGANLTSLESQEISDKGYAVVEILTLPCVSDEDRARYLLAKLQGVNDGTIPLGEEGRRQLELEMRSRGLLDKKTLSVNIGLDSKDAMTLLDWGSDRHTLAQNSTVVSAANLADKARALLKD